MTRKILLGSVLVAAVALSAGLAVAKGKDHRGGPRGAEFFQQMDTDGDGTVTQAELDALAADRFAAADANSDGSLDATELAAAADARRAERAQARTDRMMQRLDADGNGEISAEEFAARDRAGRFFERFDADGDGAVSEEEFASARAEWRGKRGDRQN